LSIELTISNEIDRDSTSFTRLLHEGTISRKNVVLKFQFEFLTIAEKVHTKFMGFFFAAPYIYWIPQYCCTQTISLNVWVWDRLLLHNQRKATQRDKRAI